MGQNASGVELAAQVLTGTFTGTGQSATIGLYGAFSFAIWNTFSGTAQLQKSYDNGTNWIPYGADDTGAINSVTAPVAFRVIESELGVIYRVACTAYVSGTVSYRLSASIPRLSDTTN